MKCIHCGKEIKDDSKFCPYCGGSVTEHNDHKKIIRFCRWCGAPVNENQKICPSCHRILTSDSEENKTEEKTEEDKTGDDESVIRFCPSCGRPVQEDQRICPSCGADIMMVLNRKRNPDGREIAGKVLAVICMILNVFTTINILNDSPTAISTLILTIIFLIAAYVTGINHAFRKSCLIFMVINIILFVITIIIGLNNPLALGRTWGPGIIFGYDLY